MEAPSGERLRGKGRHGVLCRLKAVWSMPERFRVVCTIQNAIQVLWFTFYLTLLCSYISHWRCNAWSFWFYLLDHKIQKDSFAVFCIIIVSNSSVKYFKRLYNDRKMCWFWFFVYISTWLSLFMIWCFIDSCTWELLQQHGDMYELV